LVFLQIFRTQGDIAGAEINRFFFDFFDACRGSSRIVGYFNAGFLRIGRSPQTIQGLRG